MSDTTELRIGPDAHIDPDAPADGVDRSDPQAPLRLSIAEKYEARRLEEIEQARQDHGFPPDEPTPEPVQQESAQAEPEPEPVTSAAPATGAPSSAPAPVAVPPQLHPLLTADGRTVWCTIEQIAQLAGLGATVASQPQQQPAPQVAPEPQPTITHPPSFDSEKAKQIAHRLSYGDADDQAKALMELAEAVRPATPPIDPAAIRQQVKQEISAELRVEQNLNQVGQEFPDIFSNRYATVAAAAVVNDLRAHPAWRGRSDIDMYREACRTIRQTFGGSQSQPGMTQPVAPQAAPAPSVTDRLERKRAAPSIPVATDRRVAMADTQPREPTPSEIVAQIRKSRYQTAIS